MNQNEMFLVVDYNDRAPDGLVVSISKGNRGRFGLILADDLFTFFSIPVCITTFFQYKFDD